MLCKECMKTFCKHDWHYTWLPFWLPYENYRLPFHAWVNNTHCFRTPFFSMQMRRADLLRWLPSVIWKQNPHQFDDEINLMSNVSWYLSIYLSSSLLNCVLLWKPNTQFLQTLVHTSVTYSGHSEHAQWHVQYPLILLVCFG